MATIGEELRRERHRKGLTIKDAEQVLHIRAAYLEALEEDNYQLIPGSVYVKGFLRNYANFLGLNGQELVNSYKLVVGEEVFVNVKTIKEQTSKKKSKQKERLEYQRLNYDGRRARRKRNLQQERLAVFVFIVLLIMYFIWLFFY